MKPTLLIDSREQNPWDFYGDTDFKDIKTVAVPFGDYSIEENPELVIIERKFSCDELFTNLYSKQGKRQQLLNQLEGMQKYKYKFFIIESSWDDVYSVNSYYLNHHPNKKIRPKSASIPIAIVVNQIIKITVNYDINVILAGGHGKSLCKKILLETFNREKINSN